MIIKKWVWYRINVNILNFTKNNPTGGNPVRENNRKKNKFFSGIYLCIYKIQLLSEEFERNVKGTRVNTKLNRAKKTNKYIITYNKLKVNITFLLFKENFKLYRKNPCKCTYDGSLVY